MSGYAAGEYAESYPGASVARRLHACDGWIIEREIPRTQALDAVGSYPLFQCERPERLGEDIEALGDDLVSISMVLDPFANWDPARLQNWFPDVCIPFKRHFIVDFERNWETSVSRHHRRKARTGRRLLQIEQVESPIDSLDDWCELYQQLIGRHGITGLTRFSRRSFSAQLQTPGLIAFRAVRNQEAVGMLLWFLRNDVAYYHLGAFSEEGYRLGASHAMFQEALSYFAWRRMRFAGLGAGAGLDDAADDGLARFKQGWANGTRTAWFGGRVLNSANYRELVQQTGTGESRFFPAYRFAADPVRRAPHFAADVATPASLPSDSRN